MRKEEAEAGKKGGRKRTREDGDILELKINANGWREERDNIRIIRGKGKGPSRD